jgi:hypothetical protein
VIVQAWSPLRKALSGAAKSACAEIGQLARTKWRGNRVFQCDDGDSVQRAHGLSFAGTLCC